MTWPVASSAAASCERRRLRVDDHAQQRLGDLLRPDVAAAIAHAQGEGVLAVGGGVVAEAADVRLGLLQHGPLLRAVAGDQQLHLFDLVARAGSWALGW